MDRGAPKRMLKPIVKPKGGPAPVNQSTTQTGASTYIAGNPGPLGRLANGLGRTASFVQMPLAIVQTGAMLGGAFDWLGSRNIVKDTGFGQGMVRFGSTLSAPARHGNRTMEDLATSANSETLSGIASTVGSGLTTAGDWFQTNVGERFLGYQRKAEGANTRLAESQTAFSEVIAESTSGTLPIPQNAPDQTIMNAVTAVGGEASVANIKALEKALMETKGADQATLEYASKVYGSASRVAHDQQRADKYQSTGQAWKNKAKNMSATEVAMTAVTTIHAGLHVYSNASRLSMYIRSMKQMAADITGKSPRNFSTYQMLFSSKVPEAVKVARKQLFKGMLPSMGLSLGMLFGGRSLGALAQRTVGSQGKGGQIAAGMIQMMGYQVVDTFGRYLESKADFVTNYSQIRMAQDQGMQLTGTHYFNMLISGANYAHGDLVALRKVAMQYAMEQVPVAEVMKDISMGKKHIKQIANQVHPEVAAVAEGREYNPQGQQRTGGQEILGEWTQRHANNRSPLSVSHRSDRGPAKYINMSQSNHSIGAA